MPPKEPTITRPRNETRPAETGQRGHAVAEIRSTGIALVLGALLCTPVLPLFGQDTPKPKPPEPPVPEIFTLMGQFVRVAYNNEGFVTLGCRTANASVGQEWLLLDVGMTVRKGTDAFVLKRDALSVETPEGKTLPLATQQEYRILRHIGREHLDRDLVPELRVARPVHLAHTASAQGRDDLVGA